MSSNPRAMGSVYLEWAKLHSSARYNLATSGMASYPLSELPVSMQDLEINGVTIYGYQPLQERLAHKCDVTPDCIVAASGTSMANFLAMATLLSAGDDVLIELPTYGPMREVLSYLGVSILRFHRRAENGFQVDPEELRKKITPRTKMIVLTNLHNPSGALIDEPAMIEIGEIASAVGAQVLVDEVYLDTVYDQPVRSSFHLGDNFIVTNSLTKPYGLSGLRCGWIVAQPELAKRMWRLNDLFAATPVHPGELLSVIALDNLAKVDARAREILVANRAALNSFLNSRGDLQGFRSRWGTVSFPRLTTGPVSALADLLRKQFETSVVPGEFFEMPDHFRIGIGGDPAMTAEGLNRLGQALDAFAAR